MLELGPHEQSIARQAMQSGQPLPDRIANAPQLREGLFLFLQAFFDLDSERSHAFSPTAIPWSSMAGYANAFDFDEEQKQDLFYFVRKMDSEHLKRIDKQGRKK